MKIALVAAALRNRHTLGFRIESFAVITSVLSATSIPPASSSSKNSCMPVSNTIKRLRSAVPQLHGQDTRGGHAWQLHGALWEMPA
jgi:hypothetical protein